MISNFISSSSAKGILMFGGFVLLAAGLFFIPELINLQSSLSGDSPEAARTAEIVEESYEEVSPEIPAEASARQPERQLLSPLDRVLAKFDAGAYDGMPPAEAPPEDARERGSSKLESVRLAERAAMAKVLRSGPLSWEQLKRPEITNPAARTYQESQTLLKLIDQTRPQSRHALLNFINGLHFFLRKESSRTPAKEAVEYLASLDLAVTQAFITERVEKTEYNIWKAISLGPLIDGAGADRIKRQYDTGFRADLTLVDVDVREKTERERGRAKRLIYDVGAVGIIASKEVNAAEVYVNGKFFTTVPVRPPRKGRDYTKFMLRLRSIPPGKVTIRLVDGRGGFFEKSYAFALGARKLGKGPRGAFDIPKMPLPSLTSAPDKRIDRLFWIGQIRGSGLADSGRGTGYTATDFSSSGPGAGSF